MYIKSDKHDKWKKLINEWSKPPSKDVIKVDIKVTMTAEELYGLIDEFDQLKIKYELLAMRGYYGIRPNY